MKNLTRIVMQDKHKKAMLSFSKSIDAKRSKFYCLLKKIFVNSLIFLKIKKRRLHWSNYNNNQTVYGFHEYGIGVYRFNPETYESLEYWIDYELATDEEIEKYRKYLKENKWLD